MQVQEALRPWHHSLANPSLYLDPEPSHDELVLTADLQYIPESKIFSRVPAGVYVDKVFGETHKNPGEKSTGARGRKYATAFKKYEETTVIWPRENEHYQVRRMLVNGQIVPTCHTHPIRAELEIEYYGRATYENDWDQKRARDFEVVCLPIVTFIDGFGVFRNSYRTLTGMYVTPAGLGMEDRCRPRSIVPVLLGPHGSEFGDVVKALKTMSDLDQGVLTEINGRAVCLCVWSMCYTGDMP